MKIWDIERGQGVLVLPLPDRISNTTQLLFVGDELLASVVGVQQRIIRWDGSTFRP